MPAIHHPPLTAALRFPRRIERRLRIIVGLLFCAAAVAAIVTQSAQVGATRDRPPGPAHTASRTA